jgi:hypothetical protein
LEGFAVDSPYLPGFTTAWFNTGNIAEVDESWPETVLNRLAKLWEPMWWERYLLPIGPRFAKSDSRSAIAENFLTGIRGWIETGQLRSEAPFVSQARELLDRIRDSDSRDLRISAAPAAEKERLLAVAMQLSLDVVTGTEAVKPRL